MFKLQFSDDKQIRNSNDRNTKPAMFRVFGFRISSLFVICFLVLVIYGLKAIYYSFEFIAAMFIVLVHVE